jgi:hypothetical protein
LAYFIDVGIAVYLKAGVGWEMKLANFAANKTE